MGRSDAPPSARSTGCAGHGQAREVVAAAVGARPDEVIFTGSGVHASHAAVAGLALGRRRVGARIVTTAIDHSAVLAAAAAAGVHEAVQVDHEGHVDLIGGPTAVGTAATAAACIQVANHEVGTLQPYAEAAEICRAHGRTSGAGCHCCAGPHRPQ